ncbi:MAG: hypothetical protein ACFFAE_09880 [Candidatus Hodarchaeota archaeon]
MKGSEKMAVYVGTFIFVIVGYIAALFISDILAEILVDLQIDFLTQERINRLVFAIGWFVIVFLSYWGSTRWLEDGEKVGVLSLFFVIVWLISSLAVIVGYIAWSLLQGNAEVITLDPAVPGNLVDQYFSGLFWALAPTCAALLGVSNKA